MRNLKRSWAVAACLIASVFIYLYFSLRHIRCPGLSYDEVNWANIALGEIDDTWISGRIFGVPWLLGLPYVGALKGHLMREIFAIFGISMTSIRGPGIALGLLSLVTIFLIARKLFKEWWAPVVVTSLVAINPEVIQRMRQDLGPVAIDFWLKNLVLFLFILFGESFSTSGLLAALLFCFLGLWNKLTFIWYVSACAVALIASYGPVWWQLLRWRRVIQGALLTCGFGSCLIYTVWIYFHWKLATIDQGKSTSWTQRMSDFGHQLMLELNGTSSLNFSYDPYHPSWVLYFSLIKLALCVFGIYGMLRATQQRRANLFIAIAGTLVFLQVGLTKAAIWPWHTFAIEPFVEISLVSGAILIAGYMGPKLRTVVLSLVFAGAYLEAGQVLTHTEEVICSGRVTGTGWEHTWSSMAIYPLADFLRAKPNYRFILLDWGLRTPLMLLDKNPRRTVDYDAAMALLPQLLNDPNCVFVIHTRAATAVPQGRELLFKLASERHDRLQIVQTFNDGAIPAIEVIVDNSSLR